MVDRRTVLRAGLATLAVATGAAVTACSSGSGGDGAGRPDGGNTSRAGAAGTSVAASDVPVGGGVVAGAYIVTQPKAGTFKAYSNVCPHQGCAVSQIKGGQAVCPCHGSVFSLGDGSRVSGPAPRGLTPVTTAVDGATVKVM